MQVFKISKDLEVLCQSLGTRNGFKHEATLIRNGSGRDQVKICYLNRTWERYQYESVLQKLLEKADLSEAEKRNFKKLINKN